jgi:hypothetical protein
MLPGFDKIVEERIREAASRGEFDALPGRGKPLVIDDDSHVPEELRLAYKILKNAGCVPAEIELQKEIVQAEDMLAGIEDAAERYRAIKRLNFLVMKLNTMRNLNIATEFPQRYLPKVAEKIRPTGGSESQVKRRR